MPLIGNKVTEKDVRDYLSAHGYWGDTARFRTLELVAIERPGWVQVFNFEVQAKEQEGDWMELFGTCRDDERSNQFDVELSEDESVRDARFEEFSRGLITLSRAPRSVIATFLLGVFLLAMCLAGVSALIFQLTD